MIESILVVLFVVFADRVVPARTALTDLRPDRPPLEEVYKRYGLVAFPRTILALLLIAVGIIRFAIKVEWQWIDFALVGTAVCYFAAAWYDTHKAFKITG